MTRFREKDKKALKCFELAKKTGAQYIVYIKTDSDVTKETIKEWEKSLKRKELRFG
jgi:hypothetical protein